MLDSIQGNSIDTINQSNSLDRISGIGVQNPIESDDSNYFIDESQISSEAFQKYQKEIDVKYFSNLLMQTDENEATNTVLNDIFNNKYELEESFLTELLENKDFLSDVIN